MRLLSLVASVLSLSLSGRGWPRVARLSGYRAAPGGYFVYSCTGVCVWRVKFKPKNMDSLKILHQKYWDLAYLLPKNTGKNCVLVINLMVRDYF